MFVGECNVESYNKARTCLGESSVGEKVAFQSYHKPRIFMGGKKCLRLTIWQDYLLENVLLKSCDKQRIFMRKGIIGEK